ncbi:hypothetical protein AJ80_09817 [Polytolypa hystricis UAMH7299]|uniref:glucan 1,3-beta-glucosidase n=1 Tax=Polytolypa hystricis (strain UAMH7299) TaxID=1447883 RepID=A0A2B7WJ17_POLH7|nr:hypothetical protein AJ80_09817 [Polytolypa hystricis UAMH7299]
MASRLLRILLAVLPFLSFAGRAYATPEFRLTSRSIANLPVHGVNLGGWLVLEPWITPSVFEQAGEGAVDEYTLSQNLGGNAKRRLSQHWNSFITEADFVRIKAAGLNHVRIPIGYWAAITIEGEPYVDGQLEYIDKAIGWARNTGLKVIIDLHGAPGSQNGFDNSGRRGPIQWQTGNTVHQTISAIRVLAKRYAPQSDIVTAIEALNEPLPPTINIPQLKKFYYDAWGTIRDSDRETGVIISDAFQDPTSWNGFMDSNAGVNHVVLDTHHYQVFDHGLLAMGVDEHVSTACAFGRDTLAHVDKWVIVGEWTGAMTDCAKYLNGRGRGARFDQSFPSGDSNGACARKFSGGVAGLSEDEKRDTRRFIEAQLDAYKHGSGWVFWTWKTEGAPEWDLKQLIDGGVFPQPLDNRQYPGQCG